MPVFLKIMKILGIGLGALVLFAVLCGLCGFLALLVLSKFPNWKFNELVFPPRK